MPSVSRWGRLGSRSSTSSVSAWRAAISLVKNARVVPFRYAWSQASSTVAFPTTWPSGNCVAGASPVWSTVTTT
ncbi:hypothetical protein [Streptacidiphilus rugosus]|uniref:hypothetical protein n=1 Tax=Streptacidiphilus rugosus TaxID=405783 RepID=UPI001E40E5EC|nr:hypothetical protein [Streptacidiphilus rugosus]